MFALFGCAHCWTIEDNGACYIIRDNAGQALSYVYYEEEPGRRTAANLLTNEARRIGGEHREVAGDADTAPIVSHKISPMPFEIQWTGPVGPDSTRRKSAIDALRYAVLMFGRGYTDVVIVDLSEDGKAYSLADFRQFYLDAKG